jgi:hypothetical protein
MQSNDSLIQDYLTALRILDLEGPSVIGRDATTALHRRILERIAQLDKISRPTPEQPPKKP